MSGFNRLAWLLPYVLGAAGLVTIIVDRAPLVASGGGGRWPASTTPIDPALDARLDDELRNLD